ncbi:hypothetical protein [Pseudomonas sp. JUb52]|uniref:hypothetical protein n=1 Tax=Pseudomonas sp. JUb52 TaxID=2485127 RepID=UPI00104A5F32|nr:hypothetical protein [Pseudomonas sp. JUb52]TCQ81601.1 hypothetical protein EC839_1268 [Pseudomonas sp. JUb52]
MPSYHSQFRYHTQTERPDGQNTMLGKEVAEEMNRLRIAILNRTSLIRRLSYQVEDAQLKANRLRQWALDLMKENAALRWA